MSDNKATVTNMQIPITAEEQKQIIALTSGYGRAAWFQEKTGIGADSRRRLIRLAEADEEIVNKVRPFLKSKEARALIAQKQRQVQAS